MRTSRSSLEEMCKAAYHRGQLQESSNWLVELAELRECVGPTGPTMLIAGQTEPAELMARPAGPAALMAGPPMPTVLMAGPRGNRH